MAGYGYGMSVSGSRTPVVAGGGGEIIPSSGLSLWLKADAGVTKLSYVSQIVLTCTGGLSSYSGTYIATSEPDVDGAYVLLCSANGQGIAKESFGSEFTIGPDFTLASSGDGINWSIQNVLVSGLTISGATGSYTGANVVYELNERDEDSGDIYNNNGYYAVVSTSGAVDIYSPVGVVLYSNSSFGSGAWTNEDGTGTVTASSIQLDPSGKASGSITTTLSSSLTGWADQSASGRNATPYVGFGAYSLIGDKSFITFAEYSSMTVPVIWDNVSFIGTVIVVARFASTGGGIITQEASSGSFAFSRNGGSDTFFVTTDGGDVVTSSVDANSNTNYLIGTTFNASTASLYLNGASVGTGNVSNNIGTGNTVFGGASSIAEMIVYDRVLTTPERQQVEAYLNTKYAIY